MQNNKLPTESRVELEFVVISSPSFIYFCYIIMIIIVIVIKSFMLQKPVLVWYRFVLLIYNLYFIIPGGYGYLIVFFVFDTIWVCIPCKNINT